MSEINIMPVHLKEREKIGSYKDWCLVKQVIRWLGHVLKNRFRSPPPLINAQVKVEILFVSHSERQSVHITKNFIEGKDICATI